jgi:hypothetical protein
MRLNVAVHGWINCDIRESRILGVATVKSSFRNAAARAIKASFRFD